MFYLTIYAALGLAGAFAILFRSVRTASMRAVLLMRRSTVASLTPAASAAARMVAPAARALMMVLSSVVRRTGMVFLRERDDVLWWATNRGDTDVVPFVGWRVRVRVDVGA